eukprot:15357630-Ditylum_brightwellii.AAC.1
MEKSDLALTIDFEGWEDGTLAMVSIVAGEPAIMDVRAAGTESTLPQVETPVLQVHDTSMPRGYSLETGTAVDGVDKVEEYKPKKIPQLYFKSKAIAVWQDLSRPYEAVVYMLCV